MGLDITAYRGLVMAKGNEAFDECGELKYQDGWVRIFGNPDFPGRIDGLKDGRAYKAIDEMSFRAGSYGSYNGWRNSLAELAGYAEGEYIQYGTKYSSYCVSCWNGADGPFSELINFSDCEGTIGPQTSKKLAEDFAKFQESADKHHNSYFREKYAEWRKAFDMASDNGAVCFG